MLCSETRPSRLRLQSWHHAGRVAEIVSFGFFQAFMKIPTIIVLGFLLAGCASSQPKATLSVGQATVLAVQLANTKAEELWQVHPFHGWRRARFESGRWMWDELTGNVQARVEIAADGSTNEVSVVAFPYTRLSTGVMSE